MTRPTSEETETVTRARTSVFGRAFVERSEQKRENGPGENGRAGMPATEWTRMWGNLIAWVTKGGLAIVDQGLMTGSNFVMGIVLARWLPAEQ